MHDACCNDELGRMVLAAFKHYSVRIGEWLLEQNITAFAWHNGQSTRDVKFGLQYANQHHWIEKAPTGALVLMQEGVANMTFRLSGHGAASGDEPMPSAPVLLPEELELVNRVYKAIGRRPWFVHSYQNDWQFSAFVMRAFLEGRRTEPHLHAYCERAAREKYRAKNASLVG